MTDLLLDENDDLVFADGDMVLGESLLQEVGIILRLNKGDLKSDPLLGPELVRLINSNVSPDELESILKRNFGRDGKSYSDLKKYINLERKTNNG